MSQSKPICGIVFVTAPTSMLFKDLLHDRRSTCFSRPFAKLSDLELLGKNFACFNSFDVYCHICTEIVKQFMLPQTAYKVTTLHVLNIIVFNSAYILKFINLL